MSSCLFNLYAEYILRNVGLDEAQAGIKIAGRNINNLRYADDTTVMAESKEELKSLLMKMKRRSEERRVGKEYVKAVYCHPAYLTYMKSTSCEMLGWMKHKLESRLPREI